MNYNNSTIGGKPVLDPPEADFVNWFHSGTGAGKYGHGVFLMLADDYQAVAAEASSGLSSLVMSDGLGNSLTTPVYVLSAMPYVTKAKTGVAGVVSVQVADRRYDQDTAITKFINVQAPGFPYDSATPKFKRDSLISSAEYTWAQLITSVELPTLPSAPSWKPRNVLIEGWHKHRVVDWVAAELFLVVGWNNADTYSFDVPGVMTGDNAALFATADKYLHGGGQGWRNIRRLPQKFSVKFKAGASVYTDERVYSKLVTVGGGGTTQPLHAGGYVATRSASTWLEQSNLDAVAADFAARAYAFLAVQPAMYEYGAIVPFKPDGAIREILWISNAQGARTKIMQGCRFDWSQSANGGLMGYSDPSIPGTQPRMELPSDQLVIGLAGSNTSVGPSGTRYVWSGPPMVRVYITGTGGYGGGKYAGKILPEPTSAVATSGNLTQAMLGGTVGTECLVLNMQEVGETGHWLTHADNTNQKTFLGMLDGATSGGVPIVYIGGLWSEVCE